MALTNGSHHVAIVTQDLDRFIDFYVRVFDATVDVDLDEGDLRHAFVDLGGGFWLHPFELRDGSEHGRGSTAIFQRGHLDHLALAVPDEETLQLLRSRLVEAGATDGTVSDWGLVRSVYFTDPDGMDGEIALTVPDQEPRTLDERVLEHLG